MVETHKRKKTYCNNKNSF